MGIVFFILTVLVLPGLPSGADEPRWIVLSLAAAWLFFKVDLSWRVWLLVAYVGLMTWRGPIGYDAVYIYWHFLIFVVLFCYAEKINMRSVAIGLGAGFAINSAVVLAQYLGWSFIPEITSYPGGLFFNEDRAGNAAALTAVLLVGYRLYWLIPGLLPTLVLGTRAPVAALGILGLGVLWERSRFQALMAILGSAVVIAAWMNPTYQSLFDRLGVWDDMLSGFTIFGRGLGSFMVDFPQYQTHSRTLYLRYENAHNDFLQIVFELGVIGVAFIGMFLSRLVLKERSVEWYAVWVFFIEGCFSFPSYQPVAGAIAAVCIGRVWCSRDLVRYVRADGRHGIWTWLEDRRVGALRALGVPVPVIAKSSFGSGVPRGWDIEYEPDRPGQKGPKA